MSKKKKKSEFWGKFSMDSGVLRVVRGGSEVKAPPLAARPKPAGWCGSFLMACRNKKQQEATNAGRLGAGLFSVCLETRWLGHFSGFYVPEPYCTCLHARSPCFSITLFSLSPTHSLTIAVTQTHTYALFTCVCLFLYHRVSLSSVCVFSHTQRLSLARSLTISLSHTHTLSLFLSWSLLLQLPGNTRSSKLSAIRFYPGPSNR